MSSDKAFITNLDGSMYVHALRGVVYVTWVAMEHCENALEFPADKAEDWAKLISEMTGVQCVAMASIERAARLYIRDAERQERAIDRSKHL